MMLRGLLVIVLLAWLSGCGAAATPASPATPAPRSANESAPALFVVHAEGAAEPRKQHPAVRGSADVGIETDGCCAIGVYVAASSDSDDEAYFAANENKVFEDDEDKQRRQDKRLDVIEGGVELGITIPVCENRFRLRGRLGKSGTPPGTASLGRSGFSTSLALLFRVWDLPAPKTTDFAADVDFLAGVSAVSMQRERTSAGVQGTSYSDAALMLGLRIGADYGIDLE